MSSRARRPRRVSAKNQNDLPPESTPAAIGARLKILRRLILNLRQEEIARRVGITAPAWHHYENGTNAPEWPTACRIAVTCGVTTDWIYRGDRRGLVQARRRLLEALDRMNEPDDDGAAG
jgi:DNA-binding XRE family transcriptional regulator